MVAAYKYLLQKFPNLESIIAVNDDSIVNITAVQQVKFFLSLSFCLK